MQAGLPERAGCCHCGWRSHATASTSRWTACKPTHPSMHCASPLTHPCTVQAHPPTHAPSQTPFTPTPSALGPRYYSPYPEPHASCHKLYICEYTLKVGPWCHTHTTACRLVLPVLTAHRGGQTGRTSNKQGIGQLNQTPA